MTAGKIETFGPAFRSPPPHLRRYCGFNNVMYCAAAFPSRGRAGRLGRRKLRVLRQILVGSAASLTNVAIHSLFMLLVLWAARTARNVRVAQPDMRLVIVMVATVSALMIAHFCEVMIWAQTYRLIGRRNGVLRIFRFREFHHAWLRRHPARRTMEAHRPDNGDERDRDVRVVDRGHFRRVAPHAGRERRRRSLVLYAIKLDSADAASMEDPGLIERQAGNSARLRHARGWKQEP